MSGLPEIETETSSTYKRIPIAGLFGGPRPGGVHAILYSETMNAQKTLMTQPPEPQRIILKRVIECELIIDPLQMKSIYKWLGEKIKEYETLYGPIPSPEEIESRSRRTQE